MSQTRPLVRTPKYFCTLESKWLTGEIRLLPSITQIAFDNQKTNSNIDIYLCGDAHIIVICSSTKKSGPSGDELKTLLYDGGHRQEIYAENLLQNSYNRIA
jgi:hypothetical protein